ncbi:MAG TPA: c-type cytochrome [Candidatus Solibacter sp.]|nr:c-type cytochrome [Candidatus Solibacter sp.]
MEWRNVMAGFASLAILVTGISSPRAETPLERGTYLMHGIVACGNCHTPKGPQGDVPGMELAGGVTFQEDAFTAVAPNITPDPETGIGKWTDAQIIAAIREGKRPDGTIIGPPMPIALYRGISDEDANAIVVYLRSVKPIANKTAKSEYKVPLPPSYGSPVTSVAPVARTGKVNYGRYLAVPLGHCMECHSTPGANGAPDLVNHPGGGGMQFRGPWGISHAPNITPAALGKYSDDDIKNAITKGVRPDGSRLMPPMAYGYYRNIAPADLDAIVAYLRTLKPL